MIFQKKRVLAFCLILSLFVIPSVLAISVNIEKTSSNEVLVADLSKPVVFDLKITNLGPEDSFTFYNLLGFETRPLGSVHFNPGETKNVELGFIPLNQIRERGYYTINYYIKGSDGTQLNQEATFKIVEMKDALIVGSGYVDPQSSSIEIFIQNIENFNFGEVNGKFSSPLFKFEETFDLGPKETKNFTVQINKEEFRDLMAGYYTLTAEVTADGKTAVVEGTVNFAEKDIITTTKKNFGLFVNTQVIEKKNEGNVVQTSETVIKKNIISRLFTSFSPEPDSVERVGASIYYTWTGEIRPGETQAITVKTNWLFPFIIILLVVAIVVIVKQYTKTSLVLNKKVSFVRAKGGEFALKVSIFVSAKANVERISIVDRIPPLTELYEKFGGEAPRKVDKKNRRIEWNFERLGPGETRVLSYIIYSKIGVLGKFALPNATAIFERDGEIHESESNRAFFVAEQGAKRDDE